MKTTIDLAPPLYREARIRAVEQGASLMKILAEGLAQELQAAPVAAPEKPYWANRKLRPEFQRLLESGALSGGTDSTIIISEDRTSRDEACAR